ncbi:Histidine triad (HIT) protein [Spironucleus salmonicida]|uniref:Histidine triad (HIT) protein n=1 Tax=Spironucleus salmonicida TaxID=348837 RepID=V6LXI0_9EUKA|nr:Histidine triad (HIT) protein [Spironucleus salmonicida]|eukprot:EST48426.1 Histidine triad (HIT) protein [Spironucleus salmonicida]
MADCIFCKILDNIIPSRKIYEDTDVMVIMDAFPAANYHLLIIPKDHCIKFSELSDAKVQKLAIITRNMCQKLEKLGVDNYNILNNNGVVAGQVVHHVHIHIIPKFENQGVSCTFAKPSVDLDAIFLDLK